MSSKVDDRIVNMKFNNSQFEKNVADTSKSLESLKKGLDMTDAGKGLSNLSSGIKNISLDGLASGIQTIASKFSALSIAGITALTNIANKAVDAGLTLVRALTIDPIKQGLDEYELKMGSIQTILANTARYGTSLGEVTANLDELNTYADRTIYNFGDMTKNVGLFTNAGLRVEEATKMIKGFSNEAAASGTTSAGAAGAAYQLSQALSAGTIRLMDWRSLTNVGMGNKNMQNSLIEIADAMGVLNDTGVTATDIQSDFNGSLEKNWLSAEVMSNYLEIMASDNSELAKQQALSLGLTEAQAEALGKQAETAFNAATKVRTVTQLLGTMGEAVGSGWSQTFGIIIGDFDQATELWTAVNNEMSGIIGRMSDARNNLLLAWAEGGGRDVLISAVANAWKAAMAIIQPIKEALQEIFPPMTAKNLIDITKGFENFTKTLMPSEAVLSQIKSVAKGFFAVLDIGWMIIKQVAGVLGRLIGALVPVGSGFLGMSADIGDWLVSVRDAIKNGEALGKVFDWLGDQGEKVINFAKSAAKWFGDTFPFENWAVSWINIGKAAKFVWERLQPLFSWLGEAFTNAKNVIIEFFKTMDFNVLVGLLNVGAIGGAGLALKLGVDKILGVFKGDGFGGIVDTIKSVFGAVTDTFGAMQQKLKADSLKQIAIAIGILTASVVVLSFIDTGKLFIALGAITVMFGQLSAMIVVMDKLMASVNPGKLAGIAGSMVLLAGAMLILSAAIAIMGNLEWDELAKGLIGLSAGLGAMVGAALLLDKVKQSMGQAAGPMILMATALVILAGAMKIMASMSWDDIGRSMTVLAGGLIALTGATMLLSKTGASGAGSMIAIAIAIGILAGSLKIFSSMSWDDIGRSMTVMVGAVGALVGAVAILSTLKMAPVGAASMIAMAVAITIITGAMKSFAQMSWEEIGKSMVMLAGSLVILAGAMALMGIPLVALGGVALLAASAGLMLLAPAMILLSGLSWDEIGRGLTMLAATLGILAAGGLLLIPASVGFLLLGAAIQMIGVGAFMAGAGIMMFAAGFVALTAAAVVGSEGIKIAILTIIGLIPAMMAAFAQGLIDFALVIAGGAVEFTAAMTTLLDSLINAISNVGPKVIDTLWNLLMLMASKLEENVPILVEKGGNLIIGVLNGMTSKVPGIAKAGTDLMIALMKAISNEVPRLADEGAKAIVKLVNGISTAIDNNAEDMGAAGGRLAASIVRGMVNGILGGIDSIINAAEDMASSALTAAKDFLGIHSPSREFHELGDFSSQGYAGGLIDTLAVVERAGTKVGETALASTKKSLANISSAVSSDMSMNPSIRPVLDLSAVKKDASLITGLLTPPSLKLDSSVAYASQAQMVGYEAADSANALDIQNMMERRSGDLIFNQTNNSPKALSNAELYRRTKNQLSEAKKELTTIDA